MISQDQWPLGDDWLKSMLAGQQGKLRGNWLRDHVDRMAGLATVERDGI